MDPSVVVVVLVLAVVVGGEEVRAGSPLGISSLFRSANFTPWPIPCTGLGLISAVGEPKSKDKRIRSVKPYDVYQVV